MASLDRAERPSDCAGVRRPAVALVQLPPPDPDPAAAGGANVPLAPGFLKAAAVASGIARAEDISVLPRSLAAHGGDEAVARWIASGGFDAAGFTTHLWSLRRNILIAERLRSRSPSTRIVFGGPEIVQGQPILASPLADACVVGEGEGVFVELLADLAAGKPLARIYRAGSPLDLAGLPNPYLAGFVERAPADPLYLETMRGCPHRCTYCYYAKEFPGLRSFPRSTIGRILAWAWDHGVPEVYLLDPTFNSSPGWEAKLEAIAEANGAGIPLHTELRLESVDAKRAELLARAGLRSVEVGLQSTNHRALRAVRRSWNRGRFLRGAALLAERDIEIRTGVILGLPEDTADGFRQTVSFLEAAGLADRMEIYPLYVLPGTDLRREAPRRGIRHQPFPPYGVLSTPTLGEEDIASCLRWLEEHRHVEFFTPVPPRFADPCPGLVGLLDLRAPGALEAARASAERLANRLTLLVDGEQIAGPVRRRELRGFGAWLLENAPSSLVQVVIESDSPLAADDLHELAESFHDPAHFINRACYLSSDSQGRFSVRLFRLTADTRVLMRARDRGEPCEPILRFSPGIAMRALDALEELPYLLLDAKPSPEERALARRYASHAGLLLRPDRELSRG